MGLSELYESAPSKTAEELALSLLKANLSPEQRNQYEQHGHFDVVGGTTGRRYRILHGSQMNVQVRNGSDQWISSLCFGPRGRLPIGDVLLAQKIALQLFEYEALNVAKGMGGPIAYRVTAPRRQSY